MALEQEDYLLRGCRHLVVETDAKYLYGMLNNPGRMPNATVNRWVDYIRTNFFFTLVHRKGKGFGPDGLSRRKAYPGDDLSRKFDDGSDDKGEELTLVKETEEEEDPLPLEAFLEEIDSRTGFLQEVIDATPSFQLELEAGEANTRRKIYERRRLALKEDCPTEVKIFLNTVADQEESALDNTVEEEQPYDEQRRTEIAREQDIRIPLIKGWLASHKNKKEMENLSTKDAKFLRAVSHFWLDKDGRLYRRTGNELSPMPDKTASGYGATPRGNPYTVKIQERPLWPKG
ncbi:hypothetical protein AGABI1DRAFT_133796 [Agaricus bisporus var. burnettii JB137-S8]|uniref:Reverse transcriptase RNase H-like domain-containing protein n=1 Tax=Agaricus bisporus var. burnettii (strain JB137-S8 / ATCC MYA-4627 / FGSC 10392) TaxID=597362 RepID=K5XHS3_AGABU|nr:uncharacterized protein AGABI1DRAFT_133796 [Agaricus bisporus var. burnettii JB137-S8]EKM73975.1 hypothetical protein AGABI1DRAFT_133796 [Agaricus bisporus var. burnettii JB137-S8]